MTPGRAAGCEDVCSNCSDLTVTFASPICSFSPTYSHFTLLYSLCVGCALPAASSSFSSLPTAEAS
jgi:hypothetical protein